MNILLTGGTGYIGSHTAVLLADAGHTVVLFDNFCNSNKTVSARINQITGHDIPCVEGDVRDTKLLVKTLHEFQIDAVIHFAGLKAVGESVREPLKYFDNNVAGSISLLEAMQKASVKTIVFSSSATVYGKPQYLPLDEAHPLNPINPYGRTKLQVEEILQDLVKSDPSWRVALLRYFNPVGAHDSGLIGEDPNGIPNNLMPYVMQVASGKLPHLNIFGNDYDTKDGTGERDYIHVMDLAQGHLAALNYLQDHLGCEIFNLGTGIPVSVLELVGTYEKVIGKKIPSQIASRREGDLAVCYADTSKANHTLNWYALKDVHDMCTSGIRWQTFRSSLEGSRE
ncbi:UDP-glucose 4-epimerase GalE [Polynucleobacter paneuropaeus]|uniref:UDP-glucose 4-epimerase GalE n=1 Tax=Polynucleobacter paneuropaeus TaxID=2527775 RepID=UPI000DBF1902|nr:UDP-glucose 4-epimerase GalE [Polynucleobacter paneuropaeus]AWW45629.1 UDP-glucose 4-epimerase GalE [Polynucleobacter paneuropaeus]